jgi:hypothetical protein
MREDVLASVIVNGSGWYTGREHAFLPANPIMKSIHPGTPQRRPLVHPEPATVSSTTSTNRIVTPTDTTPKARVA